MGLKILFGDGTKDLELALLENIQNIRHKNPKAHIFYLVPNKIKFKAEINVLKRLAYLDKRIGSTLVTPQVQVLSFSRLAWYYMNGTKLYQNAKLSPEALVMLVQKILNEHKDELKLYGELLNKQGFIEQITNQIKELKQVELTWNEIRTMAFNFSDDQILQNKLLDLALIGANLDDELSKRNKFLSSDLLLVLKQYLLRGEVDLSSQYFYINGYSKMKSDEIGVVEALIAMSAGVTIALPGADGSASHLSQKLDDNELFFETKRLAKQLQILSKKHKKSVIIQAVEQERLINFGVKEISDFWIKYEHTGIFKVTDNSALELWSATSRYEEVEQIAQKIYTEIAKGQLRYRDFVLMTPDLEQYQNILPAIFSKYNLPIYLDNNQMMVNHPLIAFIKQLLNLGPQYQLTSILNLLKSELLLPFGIDLNDYREALAITENFALSKNYFGSRWTNNIPWEYDCKIDENSEGKLIKHSSEKNEQLALIHNQISENVAPFLSKLEQSSNVRQMVQLLYKFLKDQGVDKRILTWRDQAIAEGNMAVAQRMEQVWNKLMNILDDTVTIFDKQKLTISQLSEVLMAAFSNVEYSGIPAAMDQILVTEIGMDHISDALNVIIFGATNVNLPITMHQKALLQDLERKKIQKNLSSNKRLDTTDVLMAQDSLKIYQSMMISSQKIIWSFPTFDGTNKMKPSTYIERLKQAFNLQIQKSVFVIDNDENVTQFNQLVGTISSTSNKLILAAGIARQKHRLLSYEWKLIQKVLNQFEKNNPKNKDIKKYHKLLNSLTYQNKSEKIDPLLVQSLFGPNLKMSISQLEVYAKNPYEFFLHYGLKLHSRSEMDLTARDQGSFMHEILEKIFLKLDHQPLGLLTNDDLKKLEKQTICEILASDNSMFKILTTSKRFEFIVNNLSERVYYALINMKRGQKNNSGIITQGTEIDFGQGGLNPLQFRVQKHLVTVNGKVDRYDLVRNSQRKKDYLVIIDYKSKKRKFNYTEAFNGLELQLLTYWQAINKNQIYDLPVRAANFMELQRIIYEPIVKNGEETYEIQQKLAIEEFKNKVQYQGLILNDEGFIEQLEKNDETPYRIARKSDGQFKVNSDVIQPEQLKILLRYNEFQIETLIHKILDGKFPIEPFRLGSKNGLQYTEYKDIIQFDVMLNNHYKDLKSLKDIEVLKLMKFQLMKYEERNDGIH